MSVIISFYGSCCFLHNHTFAPVVLDGETYPSVTNAYEASKVPVEMRQMYKTCSSAYAAQLGESVTPMEGWESRKRGILKDLLKQKFAPGTEFANELLLTQSAYLCCTNEDHDNDLGACSCQGCHDVEHSNMLGELLMEIRYELRNGQCV